MPYFLTKWVGEELVMAYRCPLRPSACIERIGRYCGIAASGIALFWASLRSTCVAILRLL
jgi:hypothetical protein